MKKIKSQNLIWILLVSVTLCILFVFDSTDKSQEKQILNLNVVYGNTSADLQSLLDYNKHGSYDLTLHIPAGIYPLYRELRIYSNTTIIADSKAKFVKLHQKGSMIANDLKYDKGGYTTSENISIIGGIWDSSYIASMTRGTESFRFIHCTNVTIQDLTVCNVPNNSHLITFAGVKNGTIHNCTLFGYNGTRNKEAIHLDIVHDARLVPSMQAKFLEYDDLPCDTINISNCEIYDYPRAIGSHSSIKGVFHKNITILNNSLHDLPDASIKAYNYINLTITGNKINNVGLGILIYSCFPYSKAYYLNSLKGTIREMPPKNYNLVINNNTITNMLRAKLSTSPIIGSGICIIGSMEYPITGTKITSNIIHNTKLYSLLLMGTPNCYIKNNFISGTVMYNFTWMK